MITYSVCVLTRTNLSTHNQVSYSNTYFNILDTDLHQPPATDLIPLVDTGQSAVTPVLGTKA